MPTSTFSGARFLAEDLFFHLMRFHSSEHTGEHVDWFHCLGVNVPWQILHLRGAFHSFGDLLRAILLCAIFEHHAEQYFERPFGTSDSLQNAQMAMRLSSSNAVRALTARIEKTAYVRPPLL